MAFGDYIGAYGAWLLILSNFFATMAIAVPAGGYTLELFVPARAEEPASAAIVGAVWIVASPCCSTSDSADGRDHVRRVGFEMVVLFAAAVAAYIIQPAEHAGTTRTQPLIPVTFGGFVAAMTLGVWVSDGWEVSASSERRSERQCSRRRARQDHRAPIHDGDPHDLHGRVSASRNARRGLPEIRRIRSRTSAISRRPLANLSIVITVMLSTLTTLWTTILYLSRSVFAMGRDAVMPRALGKLDRRDEPFWALFVVAVLRTICELVTGFSQTADQQLNTVVTASSVFLGLLFIFRAWAAVRHSFRSETRADGLSCRWPARLPCSPCSVRRSGSWPSLQWYALGGVVLGIPFALWRGGPPEAAVRAGEAFKPPNKPRQRPSGACYFTRGRLWCSRLASGALLEGLLLERQRDRPHRGRFGKAGARAR